MSNPWTTQEQRVTQDLMDRIGWVGREELEKEIFKARLRGDEFDEDYLRVLYRSRREQYRDNHRGI